MLSSDVKQYLALRRAAGFKMSGAEGPLLSYARFAAAHSERYVRTQTAIKWACASPPRRRNRLLMHVSVFARFARLEDARHQVPPSRYFSAVETRRLPFIFSAQQLRSVLAASIRLQPGTFRPKMYSTLFGLLAVTGMRSGEALRLRVSDLTDDGLLIRNSKFLKDRFVPVHPSTAAALERYLEERQRHGSDCDRLFISYRRVPLKHGGPWKVFRSLCRAAGLRCADGSSPRLHDLRHSFAVRALELCKGDSLAVREHMVALMTYLGHGCVESTYWYLHAVPTLMQGISGAAERYFAKGPL